ncbi:MAG: hypothetical protein ACREEW_01395 [Caulobacteraceae bacterium]
MAVGLTSVLAACISSAGTPSAGTPSAIGGWTVDRVNGAACVATGPTDGDASLALVAGGPMFMMIATAGDFPQAKTSYIVELSFDGRTPVSAVALGDGGAIGIPLGRDGVQAVATATRVSIRIAGVVHTFMLRNARAALDAVADCAGEPGLLEQEQSEESPKPIPGAGHWTLLTNLPGIGGRVCSARIKGDQIDTMLLLNRDGQLVLMGGHPDWATWGKSVPLQLSIDGATPVRLTADTVRNLIMVLVKDPNLLRRLRGARSVDWITPTRRVRGDVTGLGVALDAVSACSHGATP